MGTSTNDTHFVYSTWVSRISVKRLKYLAHQFYLSEALPQPGPTKRPHLPLPCMMAFSEAIIQGGASLPLHPFLVQVLYYFNLAPIQFTPNSFRTMMTFYIAYMEDQLGEPSVEEFTYIYCIKALARNKGFWYKSNVARIWLTSGEFVVAWAATRISTSFILLSSPTNLNMPVSSELVIVIFIMYIYIYLVI